MFVFSFTTFQVTQSTDLGVITQLQNFQCLFNTSLLYSSFWSAKIIIKNEYPTQSDEYNKDVLNKYLKLKSWIITPRSVLWITWEVVKENTYILNIPPLRLVRNLKMLITYSWYWMIENSLSTIVLILIEYSRFRSNGDSKLIKKTSIIIVYDEF